MSVTQNHLLCCPTKKYLQLHDEVLKIQIILKEIKIFGESVFETLTLIMKSFHEIIHTSK